MAGVLARLLTGELSLAPAERRAWVIRALEAESPARPWVVHLEDVHLDADLGSLSRQLLASRLPVLVLVTARGELTDLPSADRIELGPMSPLDHQALLARLLHLDGALSAEIGLRTGHNPRFTRALLRDWADRLEPGPQGWQRPAGPWPDFPDDLYEIWTAALKELDLSFGTDALEAAAFLGGPFTSETWATVAGLSNVPVLRQHALDQGLLELLPDGTLRFPHEMIRQTLVRRAEAAGRATGHHRACAQVTTAPERLGAHLVGCGELSRGSELLLDALHAARQAGDAHGVLRLVPLLEEVAARTVPDGAALQQTARAARVQALSALGHTDEALALADALDDTLDARLVRASVLHRRGRLDEALELQEGAVALAQRVGSASQALQAQLALAQMCLQKGHAERGASLMRDACARCGSDMPPKLVTQVQSGLAYLANREGQPEAAIHWAREASALARSHGWLRIEGTVASFEGTALDRLGRHEEAVAVLERASELFEQLGSPDVGNLLTARAKSLLLLERPDEAAAVLDRAIGLLEDADRRALLAIAHAVALWCAVARDDEAGLHHHLERTEALLAETGLGAAVVAEPLEAALQRLPSGPPADRVRRLTRAPPG